jgi:hypothetical protein
MLQANKFWRLIYYRTNSTEGRQCVFDPRSRMITTNEYSQRGAIRSRKKIAPNSVRSE